MAWGASHLWLERRCTRLFGAVQRRKKHEVLGGGLRRYSSERGRCRRVSFRSHREGAHHLQISPRSLFPFLLRSNPAGPTEFDSHLSARHVPEFCPTTQYCARSCCTSPIYCQPSIELLKYKSLQLPTPRPFSSTLIQSN